MRSADHNVAWQSGKTQVRSEVRVEPDSIKPYCRRPEGGPASKVKPPRSVAFGTSFGEPFGLYESLDNLQKI